jgi:hypothetical protein
MPEDIYLKIDQNILDQLNKRRGDLKLDEFIMLIIKEHLNNNRIKFSTTNLSSKESNKNSKTSELVLLADNLQEFANDIYNRLDRLEDKLEEKIEYIAANKDLNRNSDNRNLTSNYKSTKAGNIEHRDSDNVFIFPDEGEDGGAEDEVIFEVTDEYHMDDEDSKLESAEVTEFEYGCPYCNATIPENAMRCPKCGKRIDDMNSYGDFVEVNPLTEGYSESGEYDPRPSHVKRKSFNNYNTPRSEFNMRPPTPRDGPRVSYPPEKSIDKPVMCSNCGGKLAFIEDYKRWYCPRCNKYFGGLQKAEPKPVMNRPEEYRPPPQVEFSPRLEPSPKPRPKKPNWRPLKDYHRYGD